IIAANSYVAKLAGEIAADNKIAIVNPGVDNRITHNAQRITQIKEKYNLQNKLVLLQVGRLVERKGVDKVLKALPQVWQECAELAYVIVGDGPALEKYKLLVTSYKLQNNVILITNASDDEVDYWYELGDIFIMPAREIDGDFEGFGIVYLEANAHGKPVIAGDSGGVRDAVANGVNGILVNPTDVDEIAQAIIKLAKDEGLRKKLGERGREWVQQFDWQSQVQKIIQIL
ncbi:MAG: glycosyltransferase family 4 protein, partial [Patescibacteria group bacterium]